ncbi:MAG: class I SAM-dependent RNA methyltransferase [Deltaproteobacteria bacterium]|nr:class I SAM-dependent RNA methyltransferase [Deltaproteobacteria bacterium]
MKQSLMAGDRVTVAIDSVAYGGQGVGRVDGLVCFVPFTVDGDEAEVEIVTVRKNHRIGVLRGLIRESPARVAPPCPYFGRCGGCHYQHIAADHQLAVKEQQVRETFERIGGLPDPPVRAVIPSPLTFHYRGKAEYHAEITGDGGVTLGFRDVTNTAAVDIDACAVVDDSINEACRRLRRRISTGETVAQPRMTLWSGYDFAQASFITRRVGEIEFCVPYEGFFQANLSLLDRLVELVVARCGPGRTNRIVDCYCGSGFFTLFLASRGSTVFGIERDGPSLACARRNLKDNGISGARFFRGRVETVLEERFRGRDDAVDTVILDPPRAGCAGAVLNTLVELGPDRIVYVSCNPATQARDIRRLIEGGFLLKELQPIDLFPQTAHIETIALLERCR